MEWLKAANTSTIGRSSKTNMQKKSQTNLMLLGNLHSRQGRVKVLIKPNAAQQRSKGCEVRALKVRTVWKTCSAVQWEGWQWCRCLLTRKELRSCTGWCQSQVCCTLHCTAGRWIGFLKKICVIFAKDSNSSRLTSDKGESLVLRFQGRSNRTEQKNDLWYCNWGWS